MRKTRSTQFKSSQSGFTLIELAIVVIISGMIMLWVAALYDQYQKEERLRTTRENIAAVSAQISYFFTSQLRLPCPADRALGPDDANYGVEFDGNCDPAAIGLTAGNCTADGGLCLVEGSRDTDVDPDGDRDLILIGGVPIRDLRENNVNNSAISDKISIDAWGNKLTYAVTLSMTNNGTYKFFNGVIDARDEYNNTTAGIKEDGHYVLVSHGADGKGGFTLSGAQPRACGPVADAVDNNNCNADGVFVQALGFYEGDNPSYYDDFTYFAISRSSSLWAYIPGTQNVRNLNTQNVGIGTDNPSTLLDVEGTLRASNTARVSRICDTGGTNCFNVNWISSNSSSPPIRCPSGQVLYGIDGTSAAIEMCRTPVFQPLIPNQTCPTGEWVRAIRTNGEIVCTP